MKKLELGLEVVYMSRILKMILKELGMHYVARICLLSNDSTDLNDIVDVLKENSVKSGISHEEAESEAQVTALVSSLFPTHRGYAEVSQDNDGNISLKNLHLDDDNFATLTDRINPKSVLGSPMFNE